MDQNVTYPPISVLMPVYNGEAYVAEAIKSVLSQTFRNFEFIIINDGSTDRSEAIIHGFSDERIRYIKNEKNLGLIATLNKGIALSQGKYIARMDADDISLPNRLDEQYKWMEAHSGHVAIGSDYFNFSNGKEFYSKAPENSDQIATYLLFACCMCHPVMFLRKSTLVGGHLSYDATFKHVEDYELWTRMIFYGKFSNIQIPLFKYRSHPSQVSTAYRAEQMKNSERVRKNMLDRLGFKYDQKQLAIHNLIGSNELIRTKTDLEKIEQWLKDLIGQNKALSKIDETSFNKAISKYWFDSCGNTNLGLYAFRKYYSSELMTYAPPDLNAKLKFAAKCALRFFRK